MDIRRYGVNWFGTLDLIVDVDLDIVTEDSLNVINNFWSDSSWRLNDANGNLLFAVLKMLAQQCFQMVTAHGFNANGLIHQFDWDGGNGMEGWPPMDGSYGFKIISCDELEFDMGDITVSEVQE
ncbi:DUF2528 family protein [Candidatus Symbiopectobacterium sp. NZEC135]|uniref:DUF2528 family protein n=1 Tax=Candidatus Symbiopectobacterium sp. NZEC135 TaxID=2820471 RepID=UPI002227F336|nr:DUF2528 family protein [Candidatus Symbiopectobacterium sp. NZEC135]MCW2478862.1 DUF2528 family protein [Candidatus Symbiopectobacterium sp. NZEC135]